MIEVPTDHQLREVRKILCEECGERGAMEESFQPFVGRWYCIHCCPKWGVG